MKKYIAWFLLICTLITFVSCDKKEAESVNIVPNPIPRYTVSKSKYQNVLHTSLGDDECYYYFYYLGSVNRVPLQDDVDVYQYSGNPYEKEFSTTVSVSNTISQIVSYATEIYTEYGTHADVAGTLTGNAVNAAIEFGVSKSATEGLKISKAQSFEKAVTYSVENTDTTRFAFEKDTPLGYYRYMLFGDIDVYGVLIKDRTSGKYYTSTYEVIGSQYYDLDYSQNSKFDDNETNKLSFDIQNINVDNLPIPTNYVSTKVEYDSGFSEKKIDASNEYTFDTFDISELSMFLNSEHTLNFHITVQMKEDSSGYQEIYLCQENERHVAGDAKIEYGGPGDADKTYGNMEFNWSVSGDDCTNIMKLRYGANGKHSDDWYRARATVKVTVEKTWLKNIQ